MRPWGDCVVHLLADENATTNPIPVSQSLIQSNSAAAATVDDFATADILAPFVADVVAETVDVVVVAINDDENVFCGNV